MIMIIRFYFILYPQISLQQVNCIFCYAFSMHKQFTKLDPYLLKERVALGMLMGDNRWAGLRSLNGLDFVNTPLYLTFYNYNSQRARIYYNRVLYSVFYTLDEIVYI